MNYSCPCNLPSLWYRRSPGKKMNNIPVIHTVSSHSDQLVRVWENSFSTVESWGDTWNLALITVRESHPLMQGSHGLIQMRKELRNCLVLISTQSNVSYEMRSVFLRTCHRQDLFEVETEQLCLKMRLRYVCKISRFNHKIYICM